MKNKFIQIILPFLSIQMSAQENSIIILNPPNTHKGQPVMEAFLLRASANEFDSTIINIQDLSDLLWAANGINRVETEKRTAPSAMNSQDIDIYVFLTHGVYLYDPQKQYLKQIVEGDNRILVAGKQEHVAQAPVICLLVSDISKFKYGEDSLKLQWAAMDAGIVSQNIALFCAGTNLVTRPRATMEKNKIRTLLKLKDTQYLMLNNPVAYRTEKKEK
jgi:SagB-type dehydrogenase family enzyme